LRIAFSFSVRRDIPKPQFSVGILDEKNTQVIWQMDHDNGIHFDKLTSGDYRLTVVFENLNLSGGIYRVDVAVRNVDSCEVLSKHLRTVSFLVKSERISRGLLNVKAHWKLAPSENGEKGDR
jgi:hypothetical protein